jgi:hypothetical protein
MCLRLEAIDIVGMVKDIFLEVFNMIANIGTYGHYHFKALFTGKFESMADRVREQKKRVYAVLCAFFVANV